MGKKTRKNFIVTRWTDEECRAIDAVRELLEVNRSSFIRSAVHKALRDCPAELKKRFEEMRG